MTKGPDRLRSLLHRLGFAGPARVRAFQGSGAPLSNTPAHTLVLALCSVLAVALFAVPTPALAELCPNEAFRTGPSEFLPDCRAYEQVTPVGKNGAYIRLFSPEFGVSPEGESVGFSSVAGFAGLQGNASLLNSYQATRTSSGWTSSGEELPEEQYIDRHPVLAGAVTAETFGNAEVSLGGDDARVFNAQPIGAPEADLDLYLGRSDGTAKAIGPAVPPTATSILEDQTDPTSLDQYEPYFMKVLGISADASHVVFVNPEAEGPSQWSFGGPEALLEYAGTGNSEPMLVGVEDDGAFANGCPSQVLGGGEGGQDNAMSSNGETVFFTDTCESELFARIDNGLPDAHTVAISEPSRGDCAECDTEPAVRESASFVGASEDGSKAFFTTAQPLLPGASGVNLYEFDFDAPEGHRVVRVSDGPALAAGTAPGFEGHLPVSQDGSRVYFVARSVLTSAAGALDRVAQAGASNLYVFELDEEYPEGHIAFVATLSENDGELWVEPGYESSMSPDGRFLVFQSDAQLTPEDTSALPQLFEYDARTGRLVRVSIGNDGYNDDGNVSASLGEEAEPKLPANTPHESGERRNTSFEPSLYDKDLGISADGEYVFFESSDGLTPQALDFAVVGYHEETGRDHLTYARNVYEYHDGHVYLISDGQDATAHFGSSPVELLTTTLSGRDVFFRTNDRLVAQDTDTNTDIYDARVDGGFPPPAEPPSCEGDACQGVLAGAPVLLSPGSEFQAGGNPPLAEPAPAAKPKPKAKPKACKKGSYLNKKKTKCVKKAKTKKANTKRGAKS